MFIFLVYLFLFTIFHCFLLVLFEETKVVFLAGLPGTSSGEKVSSTPKNQELFPDLVLVVVWSLLPFEGGEYFLGCVLVIKPASIVCLPAASNRKEESQVYGDREFVGWKLVASGSSLLVYPTTTTTPRVSWWEKGFLRHGENKNASRPALLTVVNYLL